MKNTLTLSGEKKLDTEVSEEQFHRIERSYGSFARTFALPPTVDAGKVSAQYKAGVLTVRLPLREKPSPTRSRSQSLRSHRSGGGSRPAFFFAGVAYSSSQVWKPKLLSISAPRPLWPSSIACKRKM